MIGDNLMHRRFDFLDFVPIVRGSVPVPADLDADPRLGPLIREARTESLPIGAILQLFLAILPQILAIFNRDKP